MKNLGKHYPTGLLFKPCKKSKGSTSGFPKKAITMSFQNKPSENSRKRRNLKTGHESISLKKK
jgi:hypothetical protein